MQIKDLLPWARKDDAGEVKGAEPNPLATLQRGYAVLQDADGHVVTSVAGVAAKQRISVRVADGRIHATTTRTETIDRELDGQED